MSYIVLARKYRPKTFAEVVGQRSATATLRGAIEDERIGHAYLFCGPRGTGKTTTARIFAKALNCEKGPTADPCGTCERCSAAEDGSDVDIVEMDAASNRGIDDIRSLRESASYRPMRARFKIFIVDEAHMLTKEAVNAFLKTLEEPPPHVKLFFATTEPEKLLPTFLSRCQTVKLELLPEAEIAARLQAVFAKEEIRAEAGVAEEIARRSRGGLRDALSLADQVISLVGDEPALRDLDQLSEGTGREEIEVLLDRVEAGDRAGTLAALPAIEGSERELLTGLLASLRSSLLLGLCGADHPLPDLGAESKRRARERVER
ncbi:MAG: DNA polymerase III subunit gamma/tau, partial [Planctomycetota bacterium]